MVAGLERLLAKDAIRDLSTAYARGLDRWDAALMRSAFHADATVDYGFYQGSALAFVDWAQDLLKTHRANQHMMGQVAIDFDGEDRAFGEVYMFAYHRVIEGGAETDMIIAGRYADRYDRRDGVWRIAHRAEIVDWGSTAPASDGFLAALGGIMGARGEADLTSRRGALGLH